MEYSCVEGKPTIYLVSFVKSDLLSTAHYEIRYINIYMSYRIFYHSNNTLHYLSVGGKCSSSRTNQLSDDSGQISSSTTDNKGCGTSRSPWIISADPGQTIQLDLIDFAANSQTSNLVSCRSVYGFILERALGINHTICGGRHREGQLYTSKTNSVEINFLKRREEQFLVKYSGMSLFHRYVPLLNP